MGGQFKGYLALCFFFEILYGPILRETLGASGFQVERIQRALVATVEDEGLASRDPTTTLLAPTQERLMDCLDNTAGQHNVFLRRPCALLGGRFLFSTNRLRLATLRSGPRRGLLFELLELLLLRLESFLKRLKSFRSLGTFLFLQRIDCVRQLFNRLLSLADIFF